MSSSSKYWIGSSLGHRLRTAHQTVVLFVWLFIGLGLDLGLGLGLGSLWGIYGLHTFFVISTLRLKIVHI